MYLIYEIKDGNKSNVDNFTFIKSVKDVTRLLENWRPSNGAAENLENFGYGVYFKSLFSSTSHRYMLIINSNHNFLTINTHLSILLREYKLSCLLA